MMQQDAIMIAKIKLSKNSRKKFLVLANQLPKKDKSVILVKKKWKI